jgi:hypothetical protein
MCGIAIFFRVFTVPKKGLYLGLSMLEMISFQQPPLSRNSFAKIEQKYLVLSEIPFCLRLDNLHKC